MYVCQLVRNSIGDYSAQNELLHMYISSPCVVCIHHLSIHALPPQDMMEIWYLARALNISGMTSGKEHPSHMEYQVKMMNITTLSLLDVVRVKKFLDVGLSLSLRNRKSLIAPWYRLFLNRDSYHASSSSLSTPNLVLYKNIYVSFRGISRTRILHRTNGQMH